MDTIMQIEKVVKNRLDGLKIHPKSRTIKSLKDS
jgi:hypothetical protein